MPLGLAQQQENLCLAPARFSPSNHAAYEQDHGRDYYGERNRPPQTLGEANPRSKPRNTIGHGVDLGHARKAAQALR